MPARRPGEDQNDLTTVLRSLDDLSSDRLVNRSAHPAAVLKAVLDVVRSLGGGAELGEVLGRAVDGLMAVFPVPIGPSSPRSSMTAPCFWPHSAAGTAAIPARPSAGRSATASSKARPS